MKILSNDIGTNLQDELTKDCKNKEVKIAVAFFSNAGLIKQFIKQKCKVKLIVRLDEGTSPSELNQILNTNNIKIKYYYDKDFHPKLFIVDKNIYVGSANFTKKAFTKNNEITIKFSNKEDSKSYKILNTLFDDYWDKAEVLTKLKLDAFSSKISKIQPLKNKIQTLLKDKIKFHSYKRRNFSENTKISSYSKININNKIKGKKFVFTGKLAQYTRLEVISILEELGGIFRTEVSGETDYLVDTIPKTRPDIKKGTEKEHGYENQKKMRNDIKKISENQFYRMIEQAKNNM